MFPVQRAKSHAMDGSAWLQLYITCFRRKWMKNIVPYCIALNHSQCMKCIKRNPKSNANRGRVMFVLLRSHRVVWNGELYALTTRMPAELDMRKIGIIAYTNDNQRITVRVGKASCVVCTNIPIPLAIIAFQRRFRRMHRLCRLDYRLAVAMAFHPRLGAGSALRVIDAAVTGAMICAL